MHPLRPLTASMRLQSLLVLCESEEMMLVTDVMERSATTDAIEVAADVGNGQTVVIVDGKTVVMPSAVSMTGASSYQLFSERRLPLGSWDQLESDDHVFQWVGSEVETFVGALALEARESSTARGSNSRYADGWTLPLILSAIAAARPRETHLTVRLATGVPAKLWGQIAPQVKSALKGTHSFRYNGRTMRVTIREAIVEQEGPVVISVLPERFRQGRLFLIDIGERTTNVALLADGVLKSATTKEFGVGGVMDDITKSLLGRGWRDLTPLERAGLRGALINGASYSYIVGNKPQQIDPIALSFFESGAKALVRELRALASVDQADHQVAVGGGVYFFGPTLKNELSRLWMPESDAEYLTARAYAQVLGMTTKKSKAKK